MKARKVKGLDPKAPLAENAATIVLVRLGELRDLAAAALASNDGEALHDLRIAAKRLRYVLEATGFCFGDAGKEGRNAAKALQSILGELHDCEELVPEIDAHAARLRADDAIAVRAMANDAKDLDPALTADAPGRNAHRSLTLLSVHFSARRELMHDRFVAEWERQASKGVWTRLEKAARDATEPT